MFQYRMLTRISGQKKCEMVGGWIKLYNEEYHNSWPLPNRIKMIKLREMKWAGYVVRVGRRRMLIGF
jgi:hypothetical protein